MCSKTLRFNPNAEEHREEPDVTNTASPKQLRFNPTVDEYEEREDFDSGPESEDALTPVLHAALKPGECTPFDFSLPSSIFRAHPQLDPSLLDEPACTPPLTEVNIRIASVDSARGLCRIRVRHSPEDESVTVGDVLTQIREALRRAEVIIDQDVAWPHAQRLATLEAYGVNVDPKTLREAKSSEEAAGTRLVDRLLGEVLFAGITVEREYWQLHLQLSDRYTRQDR
ncbi:hypothetical protein C8R43DRAFT_291671 [Mycena crocata]|nr:hypothetical protein C8R43DRAFT_291671 [Mycena crocata]